MIITWHVNDLKVSHIDLSQITKFASYLASIYGKGLMVHRCKVHDYLGMDLNFANKGIAQILMITYTSKFSPTSPRPSLRHAQPRQPTTSSQFVMRHQPNSFPRHKHKPSTTQLLNYSSYANELNGIFKQPSPSSLHA
jgi:hypothetical protein